MEQDSIYLDYNATTPPSAAVLAQISGWLAAFGNPSSIHWAGRPSKQLLRDSRKNLADMLGCEPLELVFTGGGSESNNLALKGILLPRRGSLRSELIISAVEHPSVMKTADYLRHIGFTVHIIPIDAERGVDMAKFEAA